MYVCVCLCMCVFVCVCVYECARFNSASHSRHNLPHSSQGMHSLAKHMYMYNNYTTEVRDEPARLGSQ